MIKSFKEITAWQKAHQLVLQIYQLTEKFPKQELFGLSIQIRRAAVSIPSNLAEGFKRKSKKDTLHFYNIAESSLEEVKYQLLLAKDLKYFSYSEYENIVSQADEVGCVLNGWIKSQRQ
jgi:four helix bundle protein